MRDPAEDYVFKIVKRDDWVNALESDTFSGSDDDLRDGFIHLSTFDQLHRTAEKHFRNEKDLLLVVFAARELGQNLKWESSRNGDLFPHLYAPLPTGCALSVLELPLGEAGVALIPPREAIQLQVDGSKVAETAAHAKGKDTR